MLVKLIAFFSMRILFLLFKVKYVSLIVMYYCVVNLAKKMNQEKMNPQKINPQKINEEKMSQIDSFQRELSNDIKETNKFKLNNDYRCRFPNLSMTGHNESQRGELLIIF